MSYVLALQNLTLLGVLLAVGCRIGGGTGEFDHDRVAQPIAGDRSEDEPSAGQGGASGTGAGMAAGTSGSSADASAAGEGGSPEAGGAGGMDVADGSTNEGDDAGPAVTECGDPMVIEVCNPIDNTGCAPELGMQCDVDLLATTLMGACVFSAPSPTPDGCLNIPPTLTCPAGQTCLDGIACAQVCLCDDHCEAGECCKTPVGSGGFKACGPC